MKNKELIDSLRKIANDPEFESSKGICNELSYTIQTPRGDFYLADIRNFLDACKKWPKYSGYRYYPVPGPEPIVSAYHAYDAYDNLWDLTTEYGRNRRELALWYADYLEKQDEETNP